MNFVQAYRKKNRSYLQAVIQSIHGITIRECHLLPHEIPMKIGEWDQNEEGICPHAIVRADRVTQLLPWEYANGSKNQETIDVMVVWDPNGPRSKREQKEAYENAVVLCAALCKKYDICLRRGSAMQQTLVDTEAFCTAVERKRETLAFHPMLIFQVSVSVPELYVRSQPSRRSEVVGMVRRGDVLTVASTINRFGKLTDGGGYVDLSYTKRIQKSQP